MSYESLPHPMEDEHGEPSEAAYWNHHATSDAVKLNKSLNEKKSGKIDLKDCKVNTAEKRSNCHKHF